MLDDSECSKSIIFEFKQPLRIIEWSGPFQERHWLEIHHLPFTAFTRIMICGTHFGANSRIAGLLTGNWKAREILPFCVAQTTLRTSTQPAHLLVKSPECGRADYRIRPLPLRSCRRRSHRREPSPVVWKVRKVQRKGFLSMWPRCPCIPAIDRRQFFGGGQLRKLRNILRSPKRVWVPCQIVRCLMERLGSLHLQ